MEKEAFDKVDTETYKAFNRAAYEAVRRIKPMSFYEATSRRADQHQHAGHGGEQEAIGNAGRQVATD